MQERAANTRQAVLEGAAASFEKFGYGTASLSTIISNAGVSKGAMYFHFTSKEDLARAVMDAQVARARVATVKIVEQTPRAMDAVILVSVEMGRQLQTDTIARGGMRLTLEFSSAQGFTVEPFREWIGAIRDLAARAQDEGDVDKTLDADALARYIVASFTGVQTLSEMLTGREDLQDRLREMWGLILPALVPRRRLARITSVVDQPLIDWTDR